MLEWRRFKRAGKRAHGESPSLQHRLRAFLVPMTLVPGTQTAIHLWVLHNPEVKEFLKLSYWVVSFVCFIFFLLLVFIPIVGYILFLKTVSGLQRSMFFFLFMQMYPNILFSSCSFWKQIVSVFIFVLCLVVGLSSIDDK